MRKEAGLVKKDRIRLSIGCSDELNALIEPKMGELADKVGAEEISANSSGEHQAKGADSYIEFKIKDESFSLCFQQS